MPSDRPATGPAPAPPDAATLRAAFDAPAPLTIGLEEELMLLGPETLEPVPRARELLDRLGGDRRFKLELPAAQLEILTPPSGSVGEAAATLAAGRRALADAAGGLARPIAAGVSPLGPAEGELNRGGHYDRTREEFGWIARRQLVCALQVHVAVGGAERTLAVYNSLRSHLPELAALAANAPFHAGADTGLASVRPKIAELLPRQGMPPAIPSWEAFADALRWGAAAGAVPEPRVWWWELRPHAVYGTLELRVPDSQPTVADAAAVAAVAHALVARLAERFDAGERPAPAPTWRLQENRWSACRDGVEGTLADLETGVRRPVRERLSELLEDLEPAAARLGCAAELARARTLVERNGALGQRAAAAAAGPGGAARAAATWLAERFLAGT